jgi:ElaB/YqjD/DUF883 family membrane-anchored ribosome-binding protein
MGDHRRTKKTETLEIRLSLESKTAFMARCRRRGETASEAVRAFVEGTEDPARERLWPKARPWRVAVAAAGAGLMLGALAAPSLARPLGIVGGSCAPGSLTHAGRPKLPSDPGT